MHLETQRIIQTLWEKKEKKKKRAATLELLDEAGAVTISGVEKNF